MASGCCKSWLGWDLSNGPVGVGNSRQREYEIARYINGAAGRPGVGGDSIPGLVTFLNTFSRASSIVAMLVGCMVLAGWTLDAGALGRFLPGIVAMNPVSAVGLLLAGVSTWLLQDERANRRARWVARACAFVVVLL